MVFGQPDVEFFYGPVRTHVRAGAGLLAWIGNLLSVPNPDGWPPTIEFFQHGTQTLFTGHLHFVEAKLREYGLTSVVHYCPVPDTFDAPDAAILATPAQPGFRLKRYQRSTTRKMIAGMRGGVQLATGGGKTASYISALRQLEFVRGGPVPSLTIVTVTNLAEQMIGRMKASGLDAGFFDRGGNRETHIVGVVNSVYAAMQSLNPTTLAMLQTRDIFTLDEGHHAQAEMCFGVGCVCTARYRWALSATLYANKVNPYAHVGDMRIMAITGPTLAWLPAKYLWRSGIVPEPEISFVPVDYPNLRGNTDLPDMKQWRGTGKGAAQKGVEWNCIVNNDYRNEIIRRIVYWRLVRDPEAKIVILVQRIDHGELLQRTLHSIGVYSVFCSGGSRVSTIDAAGKQRAWKDHDDTMLAAFDAGEQRVLIGSQKFDEGQSFPMFTDLVLAQAGKGGEANRRVYQRVGRGMHSGRKVHVWDMLDRTHGMVERQAEARMLALIAEEYPMKVEFPDEVLTPLPFQAA